MRRVAGPMLIVVLLAGSVSVQAEEMSQAQWLEASVVVEGMLLSPFRHLKGLFEIESGSNLRAFDNWPQNNTRVLTKRGASLLMQYDTTVEYVNGDAVDTPAAPMYVKWREPEDIRTLVPTRWVVQTLGGAVCYDPATRQVTLNGPRASFSFVPRGTLTKPKRFSYLIADHIYAREQYLRGTLYFPIHRFEALGGNVPTSVTNRRAINGETCAGIAALLDANDGRYSLEWVRDGVTEIILWLPQTGEIRSSPSRRGTCQ